MYVIKIEIKMYTNDCSVDGVDIKYKTFEKVWRQNGVDTGIVNINDWKQNSQIQCIQTSRTFG